MGSGAGPVAAVARAVGGRARFGVRAAHLRGTGGPDRRLRRRTRAAAPPVVVRAVARDAGVGAGRRSDAGAALGGHGGRAVADKCPEPRAVVARAGLVLGRVRTGVVEADAAAVRKRERRAAAAAVAGRLLGARQGAAAPSIDIAAAQANVAAVQALELRVAADGALRRVRVRTGAATPLRTGEVPVATHGSDAGGGGLGARRTARAAPRPTHAAAALIRIRAVHPLDRTGAARR